MEIVLSRPKRRRRLRRSGLVVLGVLGTVLVALLLRTAGPVVQLVAVGVPALGVAVASTVVLLRAARPHRDPETATAPAGAAQERDVVAEVPPPSLPSPRAGGRLVERRARPQRVGTHPLNGSVGAGLAGLPLVPGPRDPLAWTGPPRVPAPRSRVAQDGMPVVPAPRQGLDDRF